LSVSPRRSNSRIRYIENKFSAAKNLEFFNRIGRRLPPTSARRASPLEIIAAQNRAIIADTILQIYEILPADFYIGDHNHPNRALQDMIG
ncbi:MAG: hypothetical protein JSU67_01045, partial [Gammaproteobacteria bacterium]